MGEVALDQIVRNARENRRNPTEPEAKLWRHLCGSKLGGFKFRRQHAVQSWIIDFFCPTVSLAIEVDGHTHDAEEDRVRDLYLEERLGVTVLRFTNGDVMGNVEGVLTTILDRARALPPRWSSRGVPHPNPSPEGEGLSS